MQYSAANVGSEEECIDVNYDTDICAVDKYTGTCFVSLISFMFEKLIVQLLIVIIVLNLQSCLNDANFMMTLTSPIE